jgi:lipopolysaccharide export system protein LptA
MQLRLEPFFATRARRQVLVLLPLLLLLPCAAVAQKLGTGKGFKAAEYYDVPAEGQMRSLLEAARVQPLPEKVFQLSEMTLQSFATNGTRELTIKAPHCLYNAETKLASSPGPLRVVTADGKFWIEGEGFRFEQATSSLSISNRVHTFIDSDVLNSASETNGKGGAPSKNSPIEIRSGKFDYSAQTGAGLYQRDVEVSGTNRMSLRSQKLAFKLPVKERQLQRIDAEKDVAVDYTGLHATGQEMTYSADSGVVVMSGNPAWRNEQGEGRGDRLTIDRTNRVFRADGNAWVRMPSHTLSLSSLFLEQAKAASGKSPVSTNQFVEIASTYHEFHTNWAEFGQNVMATERVDGKTRATMSCELLSVSYSGSNQLNNLVAEQNFILQETTNSLRGGRAVFDGTNDVLTVTERPSWVSGARSGKGEVIRVYTRTNEMLVRGNASMRLPAQELARAADPRTVGGGKLTNETTNAWAEVFSGEYTMGEQGVQFRGGVYATHPQMNWASEVLTVHSSPGGQVDQLTGETGVAFDLLDNKGQKIHGIGDKAVYTYRVSSGVTNDLLELTGNPAVLQTATSTNRNNTIVFDRANNTVRNIGNYSISTAVKSTGTNALVLPNPKPKK